MKRSGRVGIMTLKDVCAAFNDAGIPTSPNRIAAGIESGVYPFGRIITVGPTGRRSFEIFPRDVYDYLDSKTMIEED